MSNSAKNPVWLEPLLNLVHEHDRPFVYCGTLDGQSGKPPRAGAR